MPESRPNVVLVSIDSLRADHCGFLGDDRGLTPAIDALAADGVGFDRAVAPGPQTFSSMQAVFTGVHRSMQPLETYPGDSHWERRLSSIDDHLGRHASLAERFKALGYSTVGFSPNPWTSKASGFDRGFDHFFDFVGKSSDGWLRALARKIPGLDETSKPVEITLDMLTGKSFFTRWEGYYERIEEIRRQLPEPYFLWVFLMDTHYPFLPSRAHRREQSLPGVLYSTMRSEKAMRGHAETLPDDVRESTARSYRDAVRSVDAFVDRLRSDFADDDPTVILHSDHGESLGEHGNYGHHHRQLYEENVHVPYVVSVSGGASRTVDEPVSLATIPRVALSVARDGTFDPDAVTAPTVVATSEGRTNRAVRGRRFKYVEHDAQRSLFDLANDPGERTDVSGDHVERCLMSRARLERFTGHCRETARLSRAARSVSSLEKL
ncbi:MAG: sulfatase [Halanaeroarchaeum sp.]